MSASSKKKLRNAQEAEKMTEKQRQEQKEAKKLKIFTTVFGVVLALMVVFAAYVGISKTITHSGITERNTVAVTVNDHKISNAELNYFYIDAVNNFYSTYGSYASMFGLDVTKPLNEQFVDEEAGLTWADDFMTSAKDSAASTYAMVDAAAAAGFSLPEEDRAELESQLATLDLYATMYGYSNADAYLKAMYGTGASRKTYESYCEKQMLASAFYNNYAESLTYEDADLRAAEAENFGAYSSYSYNSYYLATSRFLTGGTTDSEGNTTYSDEEKAASVAAAEAAAKALTGKEITDAAALDAAIAALEINGGSGSSTYNENTLYSSLNASFQDWMADSSRKAGDVAYFPSTSGDTVSGYYVVMFQDSNDNNFAMKNVRHILVAPSHDHAEDETHEDGETYSAEELAAAKAAADEILASWKAGEATEESFAALANEKSADGDGVSGGLYENIYPGQMVEAFENWCYDAARKTGDTDIVETEYGYHVMYFVGDSEMSYRDYQIENALRSNALNEWYTEAVAAMAQTEGSTKYIRKDLVLNAA